MKGFTVSPWRQRCTCDACETLFDFLDSPGYKIIIPTGRGEQVRAPWLCPKCMSNRTREIFVRIHAPTLLYRIACFITGNPQPVTRVEKMK